MTRPKPKEMLLNFALLALAMAGIGATYKLGDALGVTRWLTSILGLTIFWLCVMLVTYRELVPLQKKGGALLAVGFAGLSIASLINEYAVQFFRPSGIYLVAAVMPSFAVAVYHEYKLGGGIDSDRGGAGMALGQVSATYRLLVLVRVAAAISMLGALFVVPLSVPNRVKFLTMAMILGFILADGIVSFARPQLCRQMPSNRFAALLWRGSLFSDPDKPRANALVSIVMFAAALVVVFAKLLGYW